MDGQRPLQRSRLGPSLAQSSTVHPGPAWLEVVQTTLLDGQESLPAQESHLLSCTNSGTFSALRGSQEVPLLAPTLSGSRTGRPCLLQGAKQEVPPQKSCTERAASPGHTCVAVRTVFRPPPAVMTGLGSVTWKREEGW